MPFINGDAPMIVGADEAVRPPRAGVEAVLAFLPIFEDPRFLPEVVVAEEEGWTLEQYTREVYEFERTLYRTGFVVRFDWSRWESEAFRYYRDPSLLAHAGCGEIRRLLTFHIRKNVICEGHLAVMLRDGHIQAILGRLAALADGSADEADALRPTAPS
jgi:hypothetical protein